MGWASKERLQAEHYRWLGEVKRRLGGLSSRLSRSGAGLVLGSLYISP